MIIKLNQDVTRSCFLIRRPGCGEMMLKPEQVWIDIWRSGLGQLTCQSREINLGCEVRTIYEKVRVQGPVLRYCAFEIEPDGTVCFLWDDKLLGAEPGRWTGTISVCGEPVATAEFQVDSRPRSSFVASTRSRPCETC